MRVFSCNLCFGSTCFSKSLYSSHLVQSEDGRAPSLCGDALEKKPSSGDCLAEVKGGKPDVEEVSGRDLVGGESGGGLADVGEEIVLKSSLKKPKEPGMDEVKRGRVKWMDILGKDLVDVHEFEPSESEDSEVDCSDKGCCACTIQ